MCFHESEFEAEYAKPLPFEFRHHEHGYCKLRPLFKEDGEIEFYCLTHGREQSSRLVEMRLCGSGRLIFNLLSPGKCGIQVVKLFCNEHIPLQVDRVPKITNQTQGCWAEKDARRGFAGYFDLRCGKCESEPRPQLLPICFTFNPWSLWVHILMECSQCGGQTILKLKGTEELVPCGCDRHPLD